MVWYGKVSKQRIGATELSWIGEGFSRMCVDGWMDGWGGLMPVFGEGKYGSVMLLSGYLGYLATAWTGTSTCAWCWGLVAY